MNKVRASHRQGIVMKKPSKPIGSLAEAGRFYEEAKPIGSLAEAEFES